jgi:dienelactone hydrolase
MRVLSACVAAIALSACAPAPAHTGGVNPDSEPRSAEAAYRTRGPNDVGTLTVDLGGGRQAAVWYPTVAGSAAGRTKAAYNLRAFVPPILDQLLPADTQPMWTMDAVENLTPVSPGRHPLVMYSHGFGGYRVISSSLATHLASWGFVVMSPDIFEWGLQTVGGLLGSPGADINSIANAVLAAAGRLDAGGPLAGHIDTTRLFPIGHSAGGRAAMVLGGRADVPAVVVMDFGFSPEPLPGLQRSDLPVLWITGQNDNVVPLDRVQLGFEHTAGERKLVALPRSGHNNAVTEICEIGRGRGGLTGIAAAAGVQLPEAIVSLANDGCDPPNATGAEIWPVAFHFITAELRYRSGLDTAPVGLGNGVTAQFGSLAPSYTHQE